MSWFCCIPITQQHPVQNWDKWVICRDTIVVMNWLQREKNDRALVLKNGAAGVAVHADRVVWIRFAHEDGKTRMVSHGAVSLPEGAVQGGEIQDRRAVVGALRTVRKALGDAVVHLSFPSDNAVPFTMYVPRGVQPDQVQYLVTHEMETRIRGVSFKDIAVQYEVLSDGDDESVEIAAIVYPREIELMFCEACTQAEIIVVSAEPSISSIARALHRESGDGLLNAVVDIESEHAHVFVIREGSPVILARIAHGGNGNIEEEVAFRLKQWDVRRDAHGVPITPIGHVRLVGAYAQRPSFACVGPYVRERAHVSVDNGDVWRRAFSHDDYIPPIDRITSSGYAAAIGAGLKDILMHC